MKTTTQMILRLLNANVGESTLRAIHDDLISALADLDERIDSPSTPWGEEQIARKDRAVIAAIVSKLEID